MLLVPLLDIKISGCNSMYPDVTKIVSYTIDQLKLGYAWKSESIILRLDRTRAFPNPSIESKSEDLEASAIYLDPKSAEELGIQLLAISLKGEMSEHKLASLMLQIREASKHWEIKDV